MKYYYLLAALCFSAALSLSDAKTHSAKIDLAQQRLDFWLAREALETGRREDYRRLLNGLQDYPLVGYLYYEDLRTRLATSSDQEIQEFLARFGESSFGARLRKAWLDTLARDRRWSRFEEVYQPALDGLNTALHCHSLQARWERDKPKPAMQEWLDETEVLWLVGRSQPEACDPIFKTLRERGRVTADLTWERIGRAMANGELSFAGFLSKGLDVGGRVWVSRWQAMHKDPRATLAKVDYPQDAPEARDIIRHGIKRLARNDAQGAAREWERLQNEHPFSAEESAVTQRELAMAFALQGHPAALHWLSAVDPGEADDRTREWRVRAAVFNQNWKAVIPAIEALTEEQRKEGDWRYWHARALEQLSEPEVMLHPAQGQSDPQGQARQIYAELAKERTYYGFLANDRLGRSYDIKADPIKYTAQELAEIKTLPGLARAHEFYQLGWYPEARREWEHTMPTLNSRQLELAAVVANRWGWYDKAIFTSAKANHRDDLELRFPLLYREQVFANAERNGLDPSWIYGVIRQESAFATEARSSAGALGLMQLMPATGKSTARLIKAPLRDLGELLGADRNIQLGSAYLREVLEANDNHQVLATAAYNAGPGRVRQWLPASRMAADIWVDNVPFTETRNYIQQVLAFTTIFSHRLDRPILPLQKRMPAIGPAE